ncbi:MAG: F0F1 ATP synthase subunit delta [Burkholderiaceae bacterium]
MEFDSTTFALEIVNFLVLVWILQRFLYKPVTNAIAQRKAAIDKTLADAHTVDVAAQSLKQQYQNRMADWEEEKGKATAQLTSEIDVERVRLTKALHASLEQEREAKLALEQRRAVELRRRLEEDAWAEGGKFAARLLSRLAGAELEAKIHGLLIEDLPNLADAELQSLRAACQNAAERIKITSRYALGEEQRSSLAQALGRVAASPVECEFGLDPELMAGLRVSIGAWVLRCNLQDELKFFAEVEHARR